jgi:hypothetical protein
MTKFARLLLIIPVLSIFTAASMSGVLAADKKSTSGGSSKGSTNTGGKTSGGGDSKGGGQSGSPADIVNNGVGGAINNAVGGLLGAFGPK